MRRGAGLGSPYRDVHCVLTREGSGPVVPSRVLLNSWDCWAAQVKVLVRHPVKNRDPVFLNLSGGPVVVLVAPKICQRTLVLVESQEKDVGSKRSWRAGLL